MRTGHILQMAHEAGIDPHDMCEDPRIAEHQLERFADLVTERYRRQVEVLHAERSHARACFDRTVKLLTRVHALLYPPPIKLEDGRTMLFRPKSLDPHEVLQELSDRIRALPDELEKLSAQSTAQSVDSPPLSQ